MVLFFVIILAVLVESITREIDRGRELGVNPTGDSCPGCGSATLADWLLCPQCKALLREHCSSCGQGKLQTHAFCPWCGTGARGGAR